MTPAVLELLQRIQAEGPVAFVAGWKVHNATEHEAFRDGLVVEVGPDLWMLTAYGKADLRAFTPAAETEEIR